jgi:hypothetical protein
MSQPRLPIVIGAVVAAVASVALYRAFWESKFPAGGDALEWIGAILIGVVGAGCGGLGASISLFAKTVTPAARAKALLYLGALSLMVGSFLAWDLLRVRAGSPHRYFSGDRLYYVWGCILIGILFRVVYDISARRSIGKEKGDLLNRDDLAA